MTTLVWLLCWLHLYDYIYIYFPLLEIKGVINWKAILKKHFAAFILFSTFPLVDGRKLNVSILNCFKNIHFLCPNLIIHMHLLKIIYVKFMENVSYFSPTQNCYNLYLLQKKKKTESCIIFKNISSNDERKRSKTKRTFLM